MGSWKGNSEPVGGGTRRITGKSGAGKHGKKGGCSCFFARAGSALRAGNVKLAVRFTRLGIRHNLGIGAA